MATKETLKAWDVLADEPLREDERPFFDAVMQAVAQAWIERDAWLRMAGQELIKPSSTYPADLPLRSMDEAAAVLGRRLAMSFVVQRRFAACHGGVPPTPPSDQPEE